MMHVTIVPILLPLLCGALSLLLVRRGVRLVAGINAAGCIALLVTGIWMLGDAASGVYRVYALGDWAAPFGIVLVQDRLSALMILLTAAVAICALLYAFADEVRDDPHFHVLFQFQLLGINGAFLTGDLFNLFVFFEILLIASYGLLLRGAGGGAARTRATLHYVVLNLVASALFLIAVGMIYGVTGTLNMADLARLVPQAAGSDGALLRSAALLLLVVFGLKAALIPLHFWLPAAYSAGAAPVIALFAVMTKVGAYAILRTFTLIFGGDAGPAAGVAEAWLLPLALASILFGTIGAVAARDLRRLVSWLVVVSVGTLLAAVGLFNPGGISAALYYLIHTTLITACLFLIADVIARRRGNAGDALVPAPAMAGAAPLGAVFLLAAISVAGLPPLSGFPGKLLVLEAAIGAPGTAWVWATVLGGTLITVVALSRAGSALFWKTSGHGEAVRGRPAAMAAVILSLAASPALALFAGPVHDYAAATTAQLLDPEGYIAAVLGPASMDAPGLLVRSERP